MIDQFIRGVLELSPRGSTSDQILWRLRSAGLRPDAPEIMSALDSLVERGEVIHRLGRWHVRLNDAKSKDIDARPPKPVTDPGTTLLAVRALIRATIAEEPLGEPEVSDGDVSALPDWDALLAYYAATQRQDPRGRISEFPDRHQQSWQLFCGTGHWWSDAALRISVTSSEWESLKLNPIFLDWAALTPIDITPPASAGNSSHTSAHDSGADCRAAASLVLDRRRMVP